MLCASEGLTFGLRPNALGLRSSLYFIRSYAGVKLSCERMSFPAQNGIVTAMQLVLQKVLSASVTVDGQRIAAIGPGYLLLVGVATGDGPAALDTLADKIAGLRLFPGVDGKINDRTLLDAGGAALVVSQFTLLGSLERGNRPDYTAAAPKDEALALYEGFVAVLRERGVRDVQTGRFGAHMAVESVNDGPVTLLLRA